MSKYSYHKFLLGAFATVLVATLLGTQSAVAAQVTGTRPDEAVCTLRYYLSPVVGRGDKADPVRPLAVDLLDDPGRTDAASWNYLYNPQGRAYALVAVASTSHAVLQQNPQLGAFPDVPLETRYDAMTSEQIEAFSIAFSRYGIDPAEMMEQSTTFRGSLLYIASWITTFRDTPIPTVNGCAGPKPRPTPSPLTCTVRYYISPVTGSGTDEDPLRPLVIDLPDYPRRTYETAWAGLYDANNYPYVLIAVASPYHKYLISDTRLGAFPEVPMDMLFSRMSAEDQAMFYDVFSRFGLDSSRLMGDATYHDILTYIVTVIEPTYPVEIGDFVPYVSECPLH